jgi:hypothetical protein
LVVAFFSYAYDIRFHIVIGPSSTPVPSQIETQATTLHWPTTFVQSSCSDSIKFTESLDLCVLPRGERGHVRTSPSQMYLVRHRCSRRLLSPSLGTSSRHCCQRHVGLGSTRVLPYGGMLRGTRVTPRYCFSSSAGRHGSYYCRESIEFSRNPHKSSPTMASGIFQDY